VEVAVAVEEGLGVAGEEVHGVVDAGQVAAGGFGRGIEHASGAGAEQHSVEFIE
jgi:hypothetical protein